MTLFPEWQEAHKDDPPLLPERIRAMHGRFGTAEGQTCKDCQFMNRIRMGKTYLKCTKSKMTHGPGTDWRAGWPACGRYEKYNPGAK